VEGDGTLNLVKNEKAVGTVLAKLGYKAVEKTEQTAEIRETMDTENPYGNAKVIGKKGNIDILDSVPEGWKRFDMQTAPVGYVGVTNGKSLFGGEHKSALVAEDVFRNSSQNIERVVESEYNVDKGGEKTDVNREVDTGYTERGNRRVRKGSDKNTSGEFEGIPDGNENNNGDNSGRGGRTELLPRQLQRIHESEQDSGGAGDFGRINAKSDRLRGAEQRLRRVEKRESEYSYIETDRNNINPESAVAEKTLRDLGINNVILFDQAVMRKSRNKEYIRKSIAFVAHEDFTVFISDKVENGMSVGSHEAFHYYYLKNNKEAVEYSNTVRKELYLNNASIEYIKALIDCYNKESARII